MLDWTRASRATRTRCRRATLDSPHGKAADPRTPAAMHQCETCHGPGEKHVDDPTVNTSIRKFAKMAPREVNAVCLSCHTGTPHTAWQGSAHDARSLACITCHSMHTPKSDTAHLKATNEIELCGTCHKVQAAKINRSVHMPLPEGKMQCSSCHEPHGSTNVRLLRVGNWINEACVSCHAEKRGPFLFEHAAGRESCITCHDPHGSSNDRLLVAKLPMLCQRCHIGTRHPVDDLRQPLDSEPQRPHRRSRLRELSCTDPRIQPSVWPDVYEVGACEHISDRCSRCWL